ncbi:hypothetical protein HDR63_00050 [bacterium]|nr:hypothetical protein [bacterium]
MSDTKNMFQRWGAGLKTPRAKRRIYVLLCLMLAGWFVFRFQMIAVENARVVFNPTRYAAENGIPVQVITMQSAPGVLYEPISVKNNRATVSAERRDHFQAGQKVGTGTIRSVARQIDLDTGMYTVRTQGVSDGLHFAETQATGYFVPTDALNNDRVFVVRDGRAVARPVIVARRDATQALVTRGLRDGDMVIVSRVQDGQKIQVHK